MGGAYFLAKFQAGDAYSGGAYKKKACICVPYEKQRVGVRFIIWVNRGLAPTPGAGEISPLIRFKFPSPVPYEYYPVLDQNLRNIMLRA